MRDPRKEARLYMSRSVHSVVDTIKRFGMPFRIPFPSDSVSSREKTWDDIVPTQRLLWQLYLKINNRRKTCTLDQNLYTEAATSFFAQISYPSNENLTASSTDELITQVYTTKFPPGHRARSNDVITPNSHITTACQRQLGGM